jgi:hypothetical protein
LSPPRLNSGRLLRRARELLGHAAVFNLQEGGKNGDVFIPFRKYLAGEYTDEALPGAEAQLMRFISHLQRRNLDVKFTEVKPPAVAPGQEKHARPGLAGIHLLRQLASAA